MSLNSFSMDLVPDVDAGDIGPSLVSSLFSRWTGPYRRESSPGLALVLSAYWTLPSNLYQELVAEGAVEVPERPRHTSSTSLAPVFSLL